MGTSLFFSDKPGKNKTEIITLICLVFLAACINSTQPIQVVKPSPTSDEIYNGEFVSKEPTSESKATVPAALELPTTPVSESTVSKSISPTASPVYPDWLRTPNGEVIVIKVWQENSLILMNYKTREIVNVTIPPPPPWCPCTPFQNMKIVCFTEDNQLLIYDYLTGQTEYLGIQTSFWSVKDQNIYFGVLKDDSEYAIYALDLETRKTTLKIPKVVTEDWNGYLEPIEDGDSFVVEKGDNRLYLIEASGKTSLIGSPNLYNSWNYTVSPTDSSLIAYGAAHSDTDVGVPDPTDAYITDLRTGKTRHIDLTIQFQGKLSNHGWPKWSPNGQQLAIFLDYWVCIYNVHIEKENCLELPDENREPVKTVAWSPDGKHLAFNMNYTKLAILNLETMDVDTVKLDKNIDQVFWR